MSEELEALKKKLIAAEEIRTKGEEDLLKLKRRLEEAIQEGRAKQAALSEQLNEQLDNVNRAKSENVDMAQEIEALSSAKQESERKKKQFESQAAEFQLRLEDSERSRADTEEKLTKLNAEAEALANQLEDNETRSSVLAKQVRICMAF